jgi:hypothetical protein
LLLLRVGPGELGDGAGIEMIGLGQPAFHLGEPSHPQRVEPPDHEPGFLESLTDPPLIAAAGLQGDHGHAQADQPVPQTGQAGLVVGDRPAVADRRHVHVQCLLADIDAGQPYHLGHLPLPFLRIRAHNRATVRADEDDDARATLRFGLQSERPSVFASPGRGWVMTPAARSFSTTAPRGKRPCLGDMRLIVERRSLRFAPSALRSGRRLFQLRNQSRIDPFSSRG